MFKRDVAKAIAKHTKLNPEVILGVLEKPRYSNLGDIAFPCFILSKKLKKNPIVIANELAQKFVLPPKGIEKVKPLGAYLNFYIDKKVLGKEIISKINKEKQKYGSSKIGKGKKVILEFSSPNIAKPMSIGHLRSTVIGHSLSNLIAFQGYSTVNINYPGDYGTQFGKLLVAYRRWGKQHEKELKKNPIPTLLKLYTKFTAEVEKKPELAEEARRMFRMLENDDKWAMSLWKKFRDISIKEFKSFYDILGVKFQVYSGESFYRKRAEGVIKELIDKNIAKKSDGALIVPFEKYGFPLLVRKSDGTSLYSTRDLAAAISRQKQYKFEKMIYVVGSEQNLYFKQVFETLQKMNYKWADKCNHVNFGMIFLPEGKMSTRKGRLVFMEDILQQIFKLTAKSVSKSKYSKKEKEKIAKAVGVSALIYGDLSNDRIKDIKFDWNKLLRLEGDSGPYIQYTYARAKSILRRLKSKKQGKPKFNPLMLTPEEESLLIILSEFPQAAKESADKLMPNLLANYILKLSDQFNLFYEKCSVIRADNKQTQQTRLALTSASAQTLKNGLLLLGMIPLERM